MSKNYTESRIIEVVQQVMGIAIDCIRKSPDNLDIDINNLDESLSEDYDLPVKIKVSRGPQWNSIGEIITTLVYEDGETEEVHSYTKIGEPV